MPDHAFPPGPYILGSLRHNDGAVSILAPCDPEEYGSDQIRIGMVDLTIQVKRGQGWSVSADDDPKQAAIARLWMSAPDLDAALADMLALRDEVIAGRAANEIERVTAARAALAKARGE